MIMRITLVTWKCSEPSVSSMPRSGLSDADPGPPPPPTTVDRKPSRTPRNSDFFVLAFTLSIGGLRATIAATHSLSPF